jgi:glycosyltransferase involved in cell wall biosynthesis
MKICLDIQSAIGPGAGVGRYTRSLAAHLPAQARAGESLTGFYFDFRRQGPPPLPPGIRLNACRLLPGALVQKAWTHLRWPPFDAFAGPHDLFHFPNFFLPPLRRGRSVVSIHDVSFLRFPAFAEDKNRRYLEKTIPRTVAQADAIVTISHFSAAEIVSLLGVDPARVHTTHLAVAPHLKPADAGEIGRIRKHYGLDQPYLLSVGTLEPRKNIEFLVRMFEGLDGYAGDLVLAGAAGWKVGPILERIARSTAASRIRHLQFVPEADLPGLYSGADLFLCASHYEGFGFPPLEAMACGTPVVSSPGGSLREVLGEAAVLLETAEPDAWHAAIRTLLADPDERRKRREAGVRQAARYTWEETARQTWALYRKVAAS